MLKAKCTCPNCCWQDMQENFTTELLSIMYREKHENIQAFFGIKCPKCFSLVSIIFEILEAPENEGKKK